MRRRSALVSTVIVLAAARAGGGGRASPPRRCLRSQRHAGADHARPRRQHLGDHLRQRARQRPRADHAERECHGVFAGSAGQPGRDHLRPRRQPVVDAQRRGGPSPPADPDTAQDFNVAGITDPRGITKGPEGKLWTGSGDQLVSFLPGNPLGFDATTIDGMGARGIAASGGRLWIADFGGGRIVSATRSGGVKRYNVGGGPQEVAGPPKTIAFANPGSVPRRSAASSRAATPGRPTSRTRPLRDGLRARRQVVVRRVRQEPPWGCSRQAARSGSSGTSPTTRGRATSPWGPTERSGCRWERPRR